MAGGRGNEHHGCVCLAQRASRFHEARTRVASIISQKRCWKWRFVFLLLQRKKENATNKRKTTNKRQKAKTSFCLHCSFAWCCCHNNKDQWGTDERFARLKATILQSQEETKNIAGSSRLNHTSKHTSTLLKFRSSSCDVTDSPAQRPHPCFFKARFQEQQTKKHIHKSQVTSHTHPNASRCELPSCFCSLLSRAIFSETIKQDDM